MYTRGAQETGAQVRAQGSRRSEFDRIVIETTGLANPAPIIQTFFMEPDIASLVVLDGVVTLVDAKHVGQHLDEEVPTILPPTHPPTASPHPPTHRVDQTRTQ